MKLGDFTCFPLNIVGENKNKKNFLYLYKELTSKEKRIKI